MRVFFAALLLAASPVSVWSQHVRGTVVGESGSVPVAGASIRARAGGTVTTTDRLGRFTLLVPRFPDTLVVTAVGWAPRRVTVDAAVPHVVVVLAAVPLVLSDLIATAPAVRSLELGSHARWRMPMAAARTLPAAVEPDVFRALALIPGVNFSSPLSARPLLRGYDAQELTTRIDGFEVLNLYHLGRIFSSFPADAASELTVSAAPYDPTSGNSVAGIVDISGRTGSADGVHGEASWSYGSLSASAGGGSEGVRIFGTIRTFYWKTLDLIPGIDVPYHFADVYAGAVIGPSSRPSGRITAFATRDRAGDAATNRYLDWDNLLLGGRWRVVDRTATSLELAVSAAESRQNGRNVPGLHTFSTADLTNAFGRASVSGEVVHSRPNIRLAGGASLAVRRIENSIQAAGGSPGRAPTYVDVPAAATSLERPELGLYGQVARRLGRFTVEASTRLDAAGRAVVILPAVRARWTPAPGVEVSGGAGRTGRLYHLLAETRSEPDFDFLDFWLSAGNGIPRAAVDHFSFDLVVDRTPVVAKLSAYASRGSGIGGIRPVEDQRSSSPDLPEYFRFGDARTRGIEAQVALRGQAASPHSASLSYVWARSDRRFGAGWVPWSLDRRHQLRGLGQTRIGRFTVHGAVDLGSGMPVTPIDFVGLPRSAPGAGADQDRPPVRVYGRENSARTSGTFRLDAGFGYGFRGIGNSRMILGASVINLLGSAVAPIADEGSGPPVFDRAGRATAFRRVFHLPPVPTLTLRAEF